jgi:heme/copper-type cytochrome/quinol oxidase subunit 3
MPIDISSSHKSTLLARVSARQLGLFVLLASISVLFVASIVAFLLTRENAEVWRGPGLPDPPAGLWWSTFLIALTSLSIWRAQRAVRVNQLEALKRWLFAALVMSSAFLLTQAANWFAMQPPSSAPSLYLSTFYILTGLHALHVVGGFVPLGIVLGRASKRQYSSSNHEGLTLCAQYWHYLGAVWLILVVLLRWGSAP